MSVSLYSRKGTKVQLAILRRCLEALLRHVGESRAALEVTLVGRARIRALNREYRKKDKVTDVLSFPIDASPPKGGRPWHLGEIVIATPVAKDQARRAGRRLTQQVLRLAIHGFVHLHGLDHEIGAAEAKRFEAYEKKYLHFLAKKGLMPWDGSLLL